MNCRVNLLGLTTLGLSQILTTAFAQAPPPPISEEQIRDIIRQAAEKDIENDKAQRNYTYIQRDEEHRLTGKGEIKSTEIRTYEI
ncbi:MAG TPA: hypothetical protein VH744_13780, partial [Terriglobales bacterium]